MKIDRKRKQIFRMFITFIIMCIAIILIHQGILPKIKYLYYVIIVLGCGEIGYHIGNMTKVSLLKKNPNVKDMLEIETNDERNKEIINRAKSKAFDTMSYITGPILLVLAFTGINFFIILTLVILYLLQFGIMFYYMKKISKEI